MPRITFSVPQDVYDAFQKEMRRHSEASVTSVVRKFAEVYARGVIYFQGRLPTLHTSKLTEFTLEVFQGEDPTKEDRVVPADFNPDSVPTYDSPEGQAILAREAAEEAKARKK